MAVGNTAIWRFRISGSNSNGAGYDPGISGAGTDYSQQNAAQVAFNGSTVTASTSGASATITLSGYTATAADIGNCLQITGGTNFTTGYYFITAQGGTTWTLDRNCTTAAGSAMTGNMGGAWQTLQGSNLGVSGPAVAGNIFYLLGSGTPNPSSYSYDYSLVPTSGFGVFNGDTTNGYCIVATDPATPGYKVPPDTTGGMAVIQMPNGAGFSGSYNVFRGIYFVASGSTNGQYGTYWGSQVSFFGCVLDQFGFSYCLTASRTVANVYASVYGCEVFSSAGGSGSNFVCDSTGYDYFGCNIHDTAGPGFSLSSGSGVRVDSCIIAKCGGDGVTMANTTSVPYVVRNCTIDGNTGNGITVSDLGTLGNSDIVNNIITNQTGVGKAGISIASGTAAANTRIAKLVDYNSFYNNTANYTAISAGPHDTALGVTPYVGSSTENYTLA